MSRLTHERASGGVLGGSLAAPLLNQAAASFGEATGTVAGVGRL